MLKQNSLGFRKVAFMTLGWFFLHPNLVCCFQEGKKRKGKSAVLAC